MVLDFLKAHKIKELTRQRDELLIRVAHLAERVRWLEWQAIARRKDK